MTKTEMTMRIYSNLGIKLLKQYPGNSGDINPIEGIWSILKRELYKKCIKSFEELKNEATRIWNSIDQNKIQSFINSMPKRIELLKRANGMNIKY